MDKAAAIPLIKTKCFIPQVRPERVKRGRLIAELNQGLRYPLILISSLPGSGKTTVLADWAGQLALPAAWVSLDEGDNDPPRFLRYFITALRSIFPFAGKNALEVMDSAELFSNETILASVINDLSEIEQDFVLVLDDFHAIQSAAILSFIANFLERLPPRAHLVIATRSDPHLPLARLRTRNKLLELRMETLRFNSAETDEYLNRIMGLSLSPDDLSALETRTEGWIASLQMAALSLQHAPDPQGFIQAFSGSNRYVMDYLVEEVLNRQPGAVQDFLLQTSILERLSGALCDAVCRENEQEIEADIPNRPVFPGGQEMLEALERANLFIIPLDAERQWYRYHHLFASLLRARLAHAKIYPAGALHRRAARWFEQNGCPEDAIHHALCAQDFLHAETLVERMAEKVWLNGQYSRLTQWISALPAERVCSNAWLCIWNAWSCTQTGVPEEANAWIERAEDAAQKQNNSPFPLASEDARSLKYHLTALKVLTACLEQDFDRAIRLAGWVLENPPPANFRSARMAQCHILHGLSYKYFMDGDLAKAEQVNLDTIRISKEIGFTLRQLHGSNKLAYVYQVSGQLRRCHRFLQDALSSLAEHGLSSYFAAAALRFRLIDLLCEWDQLEEARRLYGEFLDPEKIADVPYLRVDAYIIHARALLRSEDLAAAQNELEKAFALIHKSYIWPGLAWQAESLQVRLWLRTGDLAAAAAWAAGLPAGPSGLPSFAYESREISRARILIAGGSYPEAIHLLNRLEASAISGGRNGSLVEIDTLLSAAFQQTGLPEPAVSALEKALTLAEPEGYCRVFVDAGQPLAAVLKQIIQKNRSPRLRYARALLAKIDGVNGAGGLPLPAGEGQGGGVFLIPAQASLVEPLTKRELDVLRCMAAGLSNAETARKLVIETATVKRHIHSIFAKLGTGNRVQALNKAKENKLL